MAAISKASAPPRSPISARSRAAVRLPKRRSWWRCRRRPELRRPDRSADAAAQARATACSTGSPRRGASAADEIACAKRDAVPNARQSDAGAGAARRRPGDCRGARAEAPSADHRRHDCRRTSRTSPASAPARSASDLSVAIVVVDKRPARCWRASPRRIISTSGRAGQVDMTAGAALARLGAEALHLRARVRGRASHPETMIEDRPVRYGAYAPENFDMTFQGTVTARRALQLSLNVPAVALLDERRRQPLHRAAVPGRRRIGAAEGRGAGAGDGARRGRHQAHRPDDALCGARARRRRAAADSSGSTTGGEPAAPRRLIDPVAAWYVGNVLLGTPPPENAAGGRIAYQDRHVLRLSRRLVGRLRRQAHHRRLGRAARTARRCRG